MRICVGKDIFWVGFKANVGSLVEVLQVLKGSFELVSKEVSVDLNPAVNFNFQSFDKVPQVNFNPSLFNRGLYLCNIDLDLL